ncbi:PaaI family thioesterase [Viridibacillus sp. NPDC096237]|uniref:PaaI family thioesterase n=1 Tax=Viridibacillus sp. NPDC096237 TaxID=3390721 RepID=UPI003CFCEE2C
MHNTLNFLSHGGVIATMADTCMGTHASYVVAEGYRVVTSNLTIHYVTTANQNTLIAKSKFIHQVSRTMVLEASIEQEDGKQIAFATGSFFVIEPRF